MFHSSSYHIQKSGENGPFLAVSGENGIPPVFIPSLNGKNRIGKAIEKLKISAVASPCSHATQLQDCRAKSLT